MTKSLTVTVLAATAIVSFALPAGALAAITQSGTAPRSGAAFLTVPDYETTTADSTMKLLKGSMNIDSWSFGVSTNSTVGGKNGVVAAKPEFAAFTVTKSLDRNSGRIALNDLPRSTLLKSATVTIRTEGNKKASAYLKYCFIDVVFTSYKTTGSAQGAPPKDEISFVYGSMATSFTPVDSATGNVLASSRAGWDLLGEVVLGSPIISKC